MPWTRIPEHLVFLSRPRGRKTEIPELLVFLSTVFPVNFFQRKATFRQARFEFVRSSMGDAKKTISRLVFQGYGGGSRFPAEASGIFGRSRFPGFRRGSRNGSYPGKLCRLLGFPVKTRAEFRFQAPDIGEIPGNILEPFCGNVFWARPKLPELGIPYKTQRVPIGNAKWMPPWGN